MNLIADIYGVDATASPRAPDNMYDDPGISRDYVAGIAIACINFYCTTTYPHYSAPIYC